MSKFIEVTTYVGSSRGVVTWPATEAPAQAYAADEVYPPQTYAEAPASVDDLPGRGNMRVSLLLSLVDPRESAWLTLNGIRYAMYHQWAGWFTLDLPETAPNPFHVGRNEVVLELIVSGSPHAFPLVLEAVQKDGVIGHDPNSNIIGSITPADLVVNIPPTGAVTIGSVASLSASFLVTNWTGAYLWWSQYKEATLPPFWTKFVRTFEDTSVVGGEVVPVPDPLSKTFDFTVRTQQRVFPFMGSTQLYRGYVMHNIGSVAPERVTLGGVPGALTAVVYATESGVLRIVIQGVFGATGARLELGGEVYEVATDRYNPIGVVVDVAIPESPLVLGARQAGRLRLEGDLQATPVPNDPESQYADFVMVAGVNSGDWSFVGYASGVAGSIDPQEPVIGGVPGHAYALGYAPDTLELFVVVDDIFGATAATLIVEGVGEFQLEVGAESTYGFEGFIALPESPFVDGETYNIRLYLEGTLSNTPGLGDVVVLEAEMEVGEISPDPLVVGYDQAVDAGTLDPHTFAVGPYTASIVGVALGDGALFHPEWAGSTGVAVAVLFDAPAVGIEFSEAVFRIGEREVSLTTEDDYVDPAVFFGVFDTDWVPAVDSTHPIEVEFRDLVIHEDTPTPPYEPVGDPTTIEVGAVGSIDGLAVGFDSGVRGSVSPATIEYAGRTYTIQTADMYDRGDGEVEFYLALVGDTDGVAFAGAGFNIGGVLVGSEANTYGGGVYFWAWHEDLQPWEDGETYTITFYPGEE